jgi:hypothetical protein
MTRVLRSASGKCSCALVFFGRKFPDVSMPSNNGFKLLPHETMYIMFATGNSTEGLIHMVMVKFQQTMNAYYQK